MDCSPSGSSVHEILQARVLECVVISSSRGPSWLRNWTRVSCIASRFFTIWATREAHIYTLLLLLLLSRLSRVRLCDPLDGSPPGSPVPGILQARTLEWVAISFSHAWKWKVKVKLLSHVQFLVTPWTADYQAPLSMGFSGQEYWSGLPLLSPRPSQSLPKFMSIELVTLSNHLILCCPPPSAFNLSQHQGLFQWISCSHQVAKVLDLQLQHQSFYWVFRVDFL